MKLHSGYGLKPPMHREVPIQVETGSSKQASVNVSNLSMHAKTTAISGGKHESDTSGGGVGGRGGGCWERLVVSNFQTARKKKTKKKEIPQNRPRDYS